MLALPMINTVKLISVTTLFVTAFIATALLIYGTSGASACPQGWTRDAYGNCSVRVGEYKPVIPTSHAVKVSDHDPKALKQSKIAIAAERGDAGAQRVPVTPTHNMKLGATTPMDVVPFRETTKLQRVGTKRLPIKITQKPRTCCH